MNTWLIFMFIYTVCTVTVGWDGVVDITWMVQGSNASGSEIFRTQTDQPWSPSSLLYNG